LLFGEEPFFLCLANQCLQLQLFSWFYFANWYEISQTQRGKALILLVEGCLIANLTKKASTAVRFLDRFGLALVLSQNKAMQ